MQKIITHRLTLFFLFTAMILAIGFPASPFKVKKYQSNY